MQEKHVSENSAVAGVSAQWPARLWVVRHGQSAGNVARDVAESNGSALIDLEHRDADVPLSALGERQAEALGAWMAGLPEHERPTLILSSTYVRARQTAAAVARALGQLAESVSVDERLREKEFGVLDRYTTAGILATFPELAEQRKLVGKFYFRPPGGESWCDVIFRLRGVVGDLQRNHVGARVLIVGHQVIVNCFRYLIERMDEATILGIDREGDVPNCGVTEYAAAADGQSLELLRTKFVPPELADEPVTTESDRPAGAR
ncbi:histidine phosphatase family protein [Xanthomonas citri pv. malvacearum]|uniref:Histidine phosphatase family protein n=1 Tax=Xanthomonas campestris pv. malvacearum TaxID=86040 RepID=A0AA45BU40_XANCM|nr:histidine phosphatase family protein [Xanthomonas citri]ASN02335.1 phosphoglycerate mutase [Xanthomonas citri pv. malvacearum]ASN08570.1 phosphoglycerate mutase [Xanthomonas citri pv. malvacearum]ASY85510.1 histidine phosphatase family protein [Xanthomonas citri pv. malvacearum]MCC4630700.1 histidine phosphatase family protein [Xanthomonas citri]NMI14788.1 histidine phosphatase family protein [Xanthomonas citri]